MPYLDDWNQVSVCRRGSCGHGKDSGTSPEQEKLRTRLAEIGLPTNPAKAVCGATEARILGLQVGGFPPSIGPAPRELARLLAAAAMLASAPRVSPKAVERFTGRFVFATQTRRPLLSALCKVYSHAPKQHGPLPADVRSEVLTAAFLAPMATFPLRARVDPEVWATDSSSTGGGLLSGLHGP